ncbi:MAG: hypothetical protein GTN62_00940 [Gemmatimonadales bacterium]|nr:hypothetical protein [Gemmatimonadales bacterium]NIN48669.1 hypothetical protein [Gemmatimonadales bacterium]NIP06133.1 hypothetical protein [Gemmatimonadales bacterium]NIR01307.1 hypothetical protein [Gemmatimonadales bacterium]
MTSIRRALLFGFVIWVVPFVVAFIVFPLRESWRALFESIMPVVVTLAAVTCGVLYFRRVEARFVREGLAVGILWLAISVVIDLPLMLTGPMEMTVVEYAADIGLTYLIIPAVAMGYGVLLAETKTLQT